LIGLQEVVSAERPARQPATLVIEQPNAGDSVKRVLDIALALVGLLMTGPILLLAVTAIMATSRGPVLYRHKRCGRGGSSFECLKLRTMVVDADRILEEDTHLASAFKRSFKLVDDPRVTGVGRMLRRTSIDELPQLWNVLRGEMSLVGPRPVTREEYESMYRHLGPTVFSVRPGVTGLWQVSGRSNVSYDERVALDLQYVRTRSLTRDLKILVKTPISLVRDSA